MLSKSEGNVMLTEFQKQKLTHLFNVYDADSSKLLKQEDFEQAGARYAERLGAEPNSPRSTGFDRKLH